MNNEELLALYLDGSLTEAQRADFERLLQTSPAFAQEAREFLTIQDMLVVSEKDDERTAAFLRKVEDNLANVVIAAGAVATAGTIGAAVAKSTVGAISSSAGAVSSTLSGAVGTSVAAGTAAKVGASAGAASWASSLLSTIFASTTSMVVSAGIGLATIAGGVATVQYVTERNATPSSVQEQQGDERLKAEGNVAPSDARTALPAEVPNPNAESNTTTEQSSSQAASTVSSTPRTSEANATQAGTQTASGVSAQANEGVAGAKTREYSARISGNNGQARYATAIADYTKQLQAKESAGDRTGAAFVEKSLGVLLRQNGQLRESRLHLANAVKAAHTLGLQELEGEAMAETALLEAAEGKKERAVQGLQAAIGILQNAKSSTVTRWQKELEKIANK